MHLTMMHECSETDDNQSFDYGVMHEVECGDADIRTDHLAVPSTIPTTIQETK